MSASAPIRILAVDNNHSMLVALDVLLSVYDDLELVGQARGGEDAVRLSAELAPDVVLMDLVMPGMDGVVATRQILASQPGVRVVGLTSFDRGPMMTATLEAGAVSVMSKDEYGDVLAEAIRAAYASPM